MDVDSINWNNKAVFKTWNYRYIGEDVRAVIIDAIAVLIGDYEIGRKQAAVLLLKALLRDRFLKFLLNYEDIYPFDRNDPRVREWTKEVVSKGECEMCGSKEYLEAHHIIKWADYPQGRIDIKNGMCLCHNCHTEEHKYDQSYNPCKCNHRTRECHLEPSKQACIHQVGRRDD